MKSFYILMLQDSERLKIRGNIYGKRAIKKQT